MATAEQQKVFINFVAGLNTEATPLNFPENAAEELDNFDLFRTGEIKRRLGVEFEDSYVIRPETTPATEIDTYALSTSEWLAANGRGDLNFLVVQIGMKLNFHNLGAEPLSSSLRGSIDLSEFKTGAAPETKVMDTAFGEGVMIVGNAGMDPVIVSFDEETDTFSAEKIVLKIRDFEGIDEPGVAADDRPTTLTDDHLYNLRNQGWPTRATVNNVPRGSRGVLQNQDPVRYTFNKLSRYPSNADLFYSAKAASAEDAEVIGTYSPWALEHTTFGNTPAPRGHFILDLFSKNRDGAARGSQQSTASSLFVPGGIDLSGIISTFVNTTQDTVSTSARPSVIAFYAGRVWYSGIPDKEFVGDLYFSQQLTDVSNAGKCYQEQDPTAEDLNSLLATDGGEIHIADMGEVLWMDQVGQDLIVVSSTGIYAVSGSSGANFTAEDFTVRKITDEGAVGRDAVIEAEGSVFWWSEGGIWNMSGSQITEELQINRISKDTIQGLYEGISPASRAYSRGFYDGFNKRIYWFFNDTPGYDAINFRFRYNRALVLDLTLGAWYTYTISDLASNSPFIVAMTQKSPGNESIVRYQIVQDNNNLIEGVGNNIVEDIAFEAFADVKLKLLTFVVNLDGTYSYTFSEFKSRDFVDWLAWDQLRNNISNTGADYSSVIQTGWQDYADPLRNKYISHLTSFFNRTEDGYEDVGGVPVLTNQSGAFVQMRWDYTDLDVGQWTKQEQAYRLHRQYVPQDAADPFDYGYTLIQTKLRMRGKGKAFSIRYESETGKDMQLIGFAVNVKAPAKI
jgi:hypothetical protein